MRGARRWPCRGLRNRSIHKASKRIAPARHSRVECVLPIANRPFRYLLRGIRVPCRARHRCAPNSHSGSFRAFYRDHVALCRAPSKEHGSHLYLAMHRNSCIYRAGRVRSAGNGAPCRNDDVSHGPSLRRAGMWFAIFSTPGSQCAARNGIRRVWRATRCREFQQLATRAHTTMVSRMAPLSGSTTLFPLGCPHPHRSA